MRAAARPDRVTWHFRLVTSCLVLVAVAFSQRPGRLVGDTKLDLVVNPGGMLLRSLHLWDPQGGFGQVQNQAYGYLFPMGPFFWLGHVLSVPGWAIQRAWWSLLLVVAFLGVVKLAGALELGSPGGRIVAGFAYALSPRILTLLGPISIEAWPSAVAPWVLVPLVLGARKGSPRSAALLSALAVAAVGGVNAAATFAVIPLGVVWLLTREPGPRRRSLMTWWPLFVLVGTAWWLIPLLLLGRYSPPFLDYIESASITTAPTTLFDALRGTSHWVPYVDRTWQAGNDLISTGYVALNSGVLLLFGIVGTTLAKNRHRQFLVISLFVGLLAVTAGHGGDLHGWFAGSERAALDGVLAPLRNVHKFDPVIRLPLVLGLAHLLSVMGTRATGAAANDSVRGQQTRDDVGGERFRYAGVLALCVISVLGTAGPALAGRLGAANDFESVPGYWTSAAHWLDEHSHDTTALLAPASSFGYYVWGDPDDEPLQPLVSSPWAVRNAVPLAPAGNIRMLDAIEAQLDSGRPSDGLAGYLRRAGIGHLVVRNDLRGSDEPASVLVHQALDGSPGIRRVAAFGPRMGTAAQLGRGRQSTIFDDGWTDRYRAVEIYEISGVHRAVLASGTPLVIGGPEDLLGLTEAGLLGDEPTVLAADVPDGVPHEGLLLTDGLRRREANFARIQDAKSATLAGSDPGRRGAAAREYTLGTARWETHARILGAKAVSASSSQAFADTPGAVLPETLPFAAFDGLLDTAWKSGAPPEGRHAWVGVELESPLTISSVVVVLAGERGDEGAAARLRVQADTGTSKTVVARPGEPLTVQLPPGRTSSVKVVGAVPGRELSVGEVQIPGVDVDRTLELPSVPARWGAPDAILLSSTVGARAACVNVGRDVRCGVGRSRVGEEPGAMDRTLRLGTGGTYSVSATAAPTDGEALQGMIQRDQLVNVRASTTAIDDARASAVAAIDGDPGTTWVAKPSDKDPTLSLRWLGKRTVRSIQVELDRDAAASRPTRVELVYPGGRQTVRLDDSGRASVEPFEASRVDVRLLAARTTTDLLADGSRERVGVGVSELSLGGTGLLPITLSQVPFDIGCAFGPTLRVGNALYPTTVTASPRQLFDGALVPATVCGPPRLDIPAGSTRVVLAPAPAFRGVRLVMLAGVMPSPVVSPATVTDTSPVERELDVPSSGPARIAAVRQNQNTGWVASVRGEGTAASVTIDGWQQGWRLDGPVSRMELRFAPDPLYRGSLAVGGLLLVLLAAAGVWLRRRPGAQPPLGPRSTSPAVLTVAGVLALGVMAGWLAAACGVAAAVASAVLGRRVSSELVPWLSGLLVAGAALFYWQRPVGSAAGWAGTLSVPQLLVAAALGLLVSTDLVRPGRGTFLRRMAGRSTKR
jgi:arabinofuranan 3-O-arabinosyltransferase